MNSKRMSAVNDDAPALAGAIVYHAGEAWVASQNRLI